MQIRLSTCLLITAIIAMAIGLIVESRRHTFLLSQETARSYEEVKRQATISAALGMVSHTNFTFSHQLRYSEREPDHFTRSRLQFNLCWLQRLDAELSMDCSTGLTRQLRTRNVEQVRGYARQSLELLGIRNADELAQKLADTGFASQWLEQFRTTWSDQKIESLSPELEDFVRKILSMQDGL